MFLIWFVINICLQKVFAWALKGFYDASKVVYSNCVTPITKGVESDYERCYWIIISDKRGKV